MCAKLSHLPAEAEAAVGGKRRIRAIDVMARLAFYSFLALTFCSFAGAFVAGTVAGIRWAEYFLVPFLLFFALAAVSLGVAHQRGEIDASQWRGDI